MYDHSADLLRRHGLQVTAQRLAVLAAVSGRPHGTADDVAKAVRAEIGVISRQAVYDALGVLADKGLIRRIQPAGSPARYEDRTGDNHHHLICRTCGRMVDVDCAVGAAPCLTPADDSGFEIDEAEVIYWGRCPECLAQAPVRSRTEEETVARHSTRTRATTATPTEQQLTTKPTNDKENRHVRRCQQVPGARADDTMRATTNQDWWPNQLNLKILHQNSPLSDPMGEDFNYAEEFKRLDLEAVKKDLVRADDRLAGLVAGRLRPLRAALHPHGLAQRRHLPHRRRPRRRRPPARSASRRSTAGPTTPTSTRRAGCSGRSSRSTAARSPGPT